MGAWRCVVPISETSFNKTSAACDAQVFKQVARGHSAVMVPVLLRDAFGGRGLFSFGLGAGSWHLSLCGGFEVLLRGVTLWSEVEIRFLNGS